jgi:hypothetical protein
MKILPVRAEFFHTKGETDRRTDRQEDMKNLILGFRNFAKMPNRVLENNVQQNFVWINSNLQTVNTKTI